MSFTRISIYLILVMLFIAGGIKTNITSASSTPQTKQIDWKSLDEETIRHFQAIIQIDSSDPPGNESKVAEYLKAVLDKEGIETKLLAREAHRPNLIARLRGNGKKRPVLIMGHMDVVNVDPAKWKHGPFSATREGGYVYGRGTVDDKDNVVAGLMTMVLLKRMNVPLDRDVIFLAEAGEEGSVHVGIEWLVNEHFKEIDAEYCFAEGASVTRKNGTIIYAGVETTEKLPRPIKLVARGISGHGSVPLRSNSIAHLSQAVAKAAAWQTPMRLNETTKAYFERLATVSSPEDAARYRAIVSGKNTNEVQEYFAEKTPLMYSLLRTSVSPNMIKGGYRINVIPSEAEAMLDVRALPDEDIEKFVDELRKVINDPAVEVTRSTIIGRPPAPPSKLDTEAFKLVESMNKRHYNVITLPVMSTGATDMAYLRARGMQCYGIGPIIDVEDGPKGYGAHSDQERISEEALYKFVRFKWDLISTLAGTGKE